MDNPLKEMLDWKRDLTFIKLKMSQTRAPKIRMLIWNIS